MPGFGAQRLPNLDWSEPEDVSSNALLGRGPLKVESSDSLLCPLIAPVLLGMAIALCTKMVVPSIVGIDNMRDFVCDQERGLEFRGAPRPLDSVT